MTSVIANMKVAYANKYYFTMIVYEWDLEYYE